jgi:two-component system, chemotaxis family, protein-glutamate methylesterase/glutaminase
VHSHDIIVIGASAGGVEALLDITRELPGDLPAAVIVVLHIAPSGKSALAGILDRAGKLPATAVVDGEEIEQSRIFVAPPNCHVIVKDGRLRLDGGPRQNGHRPAVDPLFRSAADEYGPRVVGVILSGSLDDGSLGLTRVKEKGGVAVVQDPGDALSAGMPTNAIKAVAVDRIVPVKEIAAVLLELAEDPEEDHPDEVTLPEATNDAWLSENACGYLCPECGGSLWERHQGDLVQFECRVGHVYSLSTMLAEQARSLEAAMWAALQALQERESMLRRLAGRMQSGGHQLSARRFEDQAADAAARAKLIHEAIMRRPAGDTGALEHEHIGEAEVS